MTRNVQKAYEYYKTCILAHYEQKRPFYEDRRVSTNGIVKNSDWEVFAGILVDDHGTGKSSGSDLQYHEVKSVSGRSSYEYQYHRKKGLQKVEQDKTVDHVLISYSNNYRNLDVYLLPKGRFAAISERDRWLDAVWDAYHNPDTPTPLRCRQTVGFDEAKKMSEYVMRVRGGEREEANGDATLLS